MYKYKNSHKSGELAEYPGIHHVHLREFLKTDF